MYEMTITKGTRDSEANVAKAHLCLYQYKITITRGACWQRVACCESLLLTCSRTDDPHLRASRCPQRQTPSSPRPTYICVCVCVCARASCHSEFSVLYKSHRGKELVHLWLHCQPPSQQAFCPACQEVRLCAPTTFGQQEGHSQGEARRLRGNLISFDTHINTCTCTHTHILKYCIIHLCIDRR
jgi:hypothetical protein